MKKLLIYISAIYLSIFTISCDKVENPVVKCGDIDWTLFPDGGESDYTYPTFSQNTNTIKNVLVEDYTGHTCTNCPAAAAIAKGLEDANNGRVIVVSLHASDNGLFQAVEPPEFNNDFTTEAGTAYCNDMEGFLGNPMGTVNRISEGLGNTVWYLDSDWANATNSALQGNLKANIQLQYNYYPSTNGLLIHTETEFLESVSENYDIIVYVIRETVVGPQKLNTGATDHEYHHHNVLTDNVNCTWGSTVNSTDAAAGDKFYNDFSYKIPDATEDSTYNLNNLSLVSYVCNRKTHEVIQVIKTELQ